MPVHTSKVLRKDPPKRAFFTPSTPEMLQWASSKITRVREYRSLTSFPAQLQNLYKSCFPEWETELDHKSARCTIYPPGAAEGSVPNPGLAETVTIWTSGEEVVISEVDNDLFRQAGFKLTPEQLDAISRTVYFRSGGSHYDFQYPFSLFSSYSLASNSGSEYRLEALKGGRPKTIRLSASHLWTVVFVHPCGVKTLDKIVKMLGGVGLDSATTQQLKKLVASGSLEELMDEVRKISKASTDDHREVDDDILDAFNSIE